MMAKDRP